jgi:flavin reductase (DIM6/NTAB) family NADH-FMN oxidoreductase RutF/rubredoxin
MDKTALFHISYGLYVITSVKGDQKNGFIGNTTFQITSKPAQIAMGVSCDNYTHEFIRESKLFAVSVINQDVDQKLIQTFGYNSGRDIDKFAKIEWHPGKNGAPLINNGINATFECDVVQEINLGTHTIFIGKVTSTETAATDAMPLTYKYFRDVIKGKAPKNAPTYVEETPQTDNSIIGGEKYVCGVCNFEYDPAIGDPKHGYPPGTQFSDLPETWTCPVCGSPRDVFSPV